MRILYYLRMQFKRAIDRSVNTPYRSGPQSIPAQALWSIRPDLFPLPDRVWKRQWDLSGYGLTERNVYFMSMKQGGRCKSCGTKPNGKGRAGKLHIDHDHKTGKVRGLLCVNCNVALGHAKDSPTRLGQLIAYLKSYEFVSE